MTCHAHCCAVEDVVDRAAAKRDLEQYRKKGPSASTRAQNVFWRLRNTAFRLYIFPNAAIDAGIRSAGFVLRARNRGLTWVVALYERPVDRRSP
jgi:hypothetical protein